MPWQTLAGHVHVRQEVHFDFQQPVPVAGLATAALDVEAEAAGFVAPELGIVGGAEQGPNQVKGPGIGSRIGPGRPANGALVDVDDLVDVLEPQNLVVGQGTLPGA